LGASDAATTTSARHIIPVSAGLSSREERRRRLRQRDPRVGWFVGKGRPHDGGDPRRA
jgi:hypothetical protein